MSLGLRFWGGLGLLDVYVDSFIYTSVVFSGSIVPKLTLSQVSNLGSEKVSRRRTMDTARHYAYIHVLDAEGGDLYATFVQVTGTDATLCGLAPPSFSPFPLAEVQVRFGAEESTQGVTEAQLVEVPMGDVLGLVPQPPEGANLLLFAPDGSWPCAEAAGNLWMQHFGRQEDQEDDFAFSVAMHPFPETLLKVDFRMMCAACEIDTSHTTFPDFNGVPVKLRVRLLINRWYVSGERSDEGLGRLRLVVCVYVDADCDGGANIGAGWKGPGCTSPDLDFDGFPLIEVLAEFLDPE